MGAGVAIAWHKFCASAVLHEIDMRLAGMRHLIFALQRFYMKIDECRLATEVYKRNSEDTGVRLVQGNCACWTGGE